MMIITKRGAVAVLLLLTLFIAVTSACGNETKRPALPETVQETPTPDKENKDPVAGGTVNPPAEPAPEPAPSEPVDTTPDTNAGSGEENPAVEVVAEPEAIAVLVNKRYALPMEYEPTDLIEPNVPFIFSEKIDKRKMRKEAAEALENLFAGAEKDGIGLKGVSGYRSYATQKALFQRYVKRDGEAAASRYSARPGHSEHSTGLAMDVTGKDGKCAAEDCFGDTEEAKWLAAHAHEYGFIIRYPEGKEDITGYKYEPWHLRYVGVEIAAVIAEKGITLEEYYDTEAAV